MNQAQMKMQESALWPPVRAWLEQQGFTTYPEAFRHDVMAVRGREIWVVELKMCATRHAIRQTFRAMWCARKRWVASPTTPRDTTLACAARAGVGILRVHDGHVQVVLDSPDESDQISERAVSHRLARLAKYKDTGAVAGMPNLKGRGPAQQVYARVEAYLRTHGDTSWADLFEHVPNHYKHVRSMRSALRHFWEGAK